MSRTNELFANLVQEFNGALDRAATAHENKASKAAADEILTTLMTSPVLLRP